VCSTYAQKTRDKEKETAQKK
jgi:hypothetical protein